jgi:4a-hydroxytetrahydrobiopterin dehydratase
MLTLGEIQAYMNTLKDWSLEGSKITKNFSFSTFREAAEFVGKIGEIAEKMSHEPDVLLMQKEVRIILTTHDVQSLTKVDFDFAREIDKVDFGAGGDKIESEESKEENDS